MSLYKFYESCLRTAKETYTRLVNTPRARAGNLQDEIKDIQRQITTAFSREELSKEEADYFYDEFSKIHFEKLAEDRAALKERSNKTNPFSRWGSVEMENKLLTNKDIGEILGVDAITARTYLSSYLFAKYRSKVKLKNSLKDAYIFNRGFTYAMSEFLIKRRNFKALKRFEEYCEKIEVGGDE